MQELSLKTLSASERPLASLPCLRARSLAKHPHAFKGYVAFVSTHSPGAPNSPRQVLFTSVGPKVGIAFVLGALGLLQLHVKISTDRKLEDPAGLETYMRPSCQGCRASSVVPLTTARHWRPISLSGCQLPTVSCPVQCWNP